MGTVGIADNVAAVVAYIRTEEMDNCVVETVHVVPAGAKACPDKGNDVVAAAPHQVFSHQNSEAPSWEGITAPIL